MVVYLTGNSRFKKELYIKDYFNKYKNYQYIKIFSNDEGKLEELKNASISLGLFSEGKIYDLVDFDEWSKSEKEEFYKIEFHDENVIVLVRTEKAIQKDLKNKVIVQNFDKPKDWEDEKWLQFIMDSAKLIDVEISQEIAHELLEIVGPDEDTIISELEKIKIYSLGKPYIEDIEDITYKRTVSKLDEFAYLLSEGRLDEAKNLIFEISNEYEPVFVLYALSKHFIELLNLIATVERKHKYSWPQIKEISKQTDIPIPRVTRFLGLRFKDSKFSPINHLEKYTLKKVKKVLEYLYSMDRQIKLGADTKVVLANFITYLKNL